MFKYMVNQIITCHPQILNCICPLPRLTGATRQERLVWKGDEFNVMYC